MIRGTTPTLRFKVEGADFSEVATLYITLKQNTKFLEKHLEDTEIDDDTLIISLTQEETLQFQKGAIQAQVRFTNSDGKAYATNIISFMVDPILLDGKIE